MADLVKRLNYFDGQFLRQNDFNNEQDYHVQHQRDHARLLHTPGIAEGLDIPDPPAGATAVTVHAGVAYDDLGRRILLADNATLELADLAADQTIYVTIAYGESQTDPTDETGITGKTRWTEAPLIETLNAAPGNANEKLVLARIERSGTVVGTIHRDERRAAGVRGGDLEVLSVTLTSESIAPSGWVKAELGASGRADVGGNLRVAGDLVVTGSIQGNIAVNTVETGDLVDNAVTSAKLAEADNAVTGQNTNAGSGVKTNHIQDEAVTLLKLAPAVRPIVSIEGVSNAGGNIDLVPANTITVVGNNTTKQIIIGESHSAVAGNPHNTTAAQVGALVSVESVSNPGGNIDVVPANAITVVGNNATKQITIGENHSSRTDNPHTTTAAQVGALPLAGGTLSGALTVNGNLRASNNTLLLGGATSSTSGNHIGLGQPGDQNVTVFLTAATNTTVSTGTKTAMMIWPITSGYKGLEMMSAQGGVDTLTVAGTARFTGTKIGYVADTFINGSGQVLHTGDIVKLKSGGVMRFQGDHNRIPVPEVTLADKEDDPLVIGVVAQEATPPPDEPDHRTEPEDPTSIPTGGELFVVTLGAFAHCRVDANEAPIAVGDLLASSSRPGYAHKASNPKIGAIIGKALEALPEGSGYIAVFVNIQ
jgi:hypothetical protein